MQSSKSISSKSEHLSLTDRLESVKAGSLGAIASVFGFFATALLHHLFQNILQSFLQDIPLIKGFELGNPWVLFLKLGMAGFSGFLFAVTYRYIVRRDRNSHLRSGAILAFALIHSFGAIEQNLVNLTAFPLITMAIAIAIVVLENVAWLAIVQSILAAAIESRWIADFSSIGD